MCAYALDGYGLDSMLIRCRASSYAGSLLRFIGHNVCRRFSTISVRTETAKFVVAPPRIYAGEGAL